MMNKTKGNMYDWVTHTWNPIKGRCPHDCSYCYMKRFPQKELRLDENTYSDNLGYGNTIFVGSSTDMFAKEVPTDWIRLVLGKCNLSDKNKYLFQSKNPERFFDFDGCFPDDVILGTTLESNREIMRGFAPGRKDRACAMIKIGVKKMVSIEPVIDFDLKPFVAMIKDISPVFVSIGADSGGHKLPEPCKEKVEALIKELRKFTEVKIKDNLKRLYK